MKELDDFRAEIAAFLKRHAMPETTFGRLVLNDTAFVHDLRKQRMPNMLTVSKCRAFMAKRDKAAAKRRASPLAELSA